MNRKPKRDGFPLSPRSSSLVLVSAVATPVGGNLTANSIASGWISSGWFSGRANNGISIVYIPVIGS